MPPRRAKARPLSTLHLGALAGAVLAGCGSRGDTAVPSGTGVPTVALAPPSAAASDEAPALPPPAVGRGFEIVRVDDEDGAPLREVERLLATGMGEAIRIERERIGMGARSVETRYAMTRPRAGEPIEAVRARMLTVLGIVPLPAGKRWLVAEVRLPRGAGDPPEVFVRSYLASGPAVVRAGDVVGAEIREEDWGTSLQIELSPSAAERFREATAASLERRLAIVFDDRVMSAPVVKSEISGGKVQITMGGGPSDAQRAEAERLRRALLAGR
ncbi:MAG: hypothetical protein IT373_08345 [Polyangiaceae bacterium]|nr:hypothetical protein [Polyangiaceae bacterium]